MLPEKQYQENNSLIQKAQAGDEDARSKVYEANIGLVYMVLERFRNTSYDYEDLFQVGSIGLVKAIDKFDFSFNVRFSTYAVPMIIGEVKKFLRDDGMVKVQRSLKESYSKIRWAQDKLRGNLGKEPTISEIACLLDMDKEEIVMAIEACQATTSLHDVFAGEEKSAVSLIDKLFSEESNTMMLEKLSLREAVSKLEHREQEIIIRRFFRDETQSAIADDLGVSQVQVSRLEKSALLKLKKVLE
ncbi:MAG: SigB/SigF/SigG family RNA polymerase sigma factor [Syntrophomonas sp.]|nr:SigB/SigF/SigG family RNA polymerase sigma factor [Syntrophomonas sp.]